MIAAVLGALVVLTPLFLLPAIGTGFEAKLALYSVPERVESPEELYGLSKAPVQGYLAVSLTLVVGLAAAMAAYSIVRVRLSHQRRKCML